LVEDEARLEEKPGLKIVWYPKGKRPVIKISTSKKAKSFYGALNVKTGKEHPKMYNWQNQEHTVDFLKYLRKLYPLKKIILFWDGAPWHKGERIRRYLKRTKNLLLVSFPPYSPELNPQEIVWRIARQKITHNHQEENLEVLADKFHKFLLRTKFKTNFLNKFGVNSI